MSDTPIYDEMKREERFRRCLQTYTKHYEFAPPTDSYGRGWSFATSMLEDALENGDYAGALMVPDTVKSNDMWFRTGYRDAMNQIKRGSKVDA